MPRWATIIMKLIAYVWVTAITLFMLYEYMKYVMLGIDTGTFWMMLGILAAFCCFAWSAWNDHSTIRYLKNQLKAYEENVNYKGRARWNMPKWATIIVKTIVYIWVAAMTLFILWVWTELAIHGGHLADNVFWMALGSLAGCCCFALSALSDYLTIRCLKNHLGTHEYMAAKPRRPLHPPAPASME
ncbi:MAG: hypothetical protein LBU66_01710 [Treponema sp.]|jgi:hypothetical protein|nr:hypothetical protein [Treponema sp.]